MDDPRVAWLAANIAAHCKSSGVDVQSVHEKSLSRENACAITSFLDSTALALLAIILHTAEGIELNVTTDVKFPIPANGAGLAFTKQSPKPLCGLDEMESNVMICSLTANVAACLFHTVRNIYTPILSSGEHVVGSNTQRLLSNLDVALTKEILQQNDASSSSELVGISRPSDEIDFWQTRKGNAMAADSIADALAAMQVPLEALSSHVISFKSAADEVETVSNSLMTIWDACDLGQQAEYPEHRMCHLLHLISHHITAFAAEKLISNVCERSCSAAHSGGNAVGHILWGFSTPSDIAASESSVSDALSLLHVWRDRHVKQLMLDWMPGHRSISPHVWSGTEFKDEHLDAHVARFEQIRDLLGLKRELLKALGGEEREVVQDAFAILGTADPFTAGLMSERAWAAARASLDSALAALDGMVAARVQARITSHVLPALTAPNIKDQSGADRGALTAQPLQMLMELQGQRRVLQRPAVAAALSTECPRLAAAVGNAATHAVAGVAAGAALGCQQDGSAAGMLAKIKQAGLRVDAAECALSALRGAGSTQPEIADVLADMHDLQKRLKRTEQEVFDRWLRQVKDDLDGMHGWQSARLLETDAVAGCHLKVFFSCRLTDVVTQVRDVAALGFRIPITVAQEVKIAEKFYHYGMALQQVANFHNTMADHLLECHKPCLLESAKAFEAVCLRPVDGQGRAITWSTGGALDAYMSRLQAARQTLLDKNNALRAKHAAIAEQMGALARLDLVQQRKRWFAAVENIRRTFHRAEGEFPRELQIAWRLYWDKQLLKVLDAQFARDLQSLLPRLPPQHVRLVYTQQAAQFDPSLDDIRAAFYRDHVDAYITIPCQVCGFSPAHEVKGSQFFKSVLTRNAQAIASVYAFVEGNTFNNLRKLLARSAPWAVLGSQPNLDGFVASLATSVAAADHLFENTKAAQRDLSRAIPSEVQEGCFIVSTGPFKAAVEAHIAAARSSVSRAVYASAVTDRDVIAVFTTQSKDMLNAQATSLSELGEARTKALEIMKQVPEMRSRRKEVDAKNSLLAALAKSIAGAGTSASATVAPQVDVSEAAADWDSLMASLTAHEGFLERQKDDLAKQVLGNIERFQKQVDALRLRWSEVKPTGAPKASTDTLMVQFDEIRAQSQAFVAEAEQLVRDAQAFEQPEPEFASLHELQRDVEATVAAWSIYGGYAKEKEELVKSRWAEIRLQLHRFDDFVAHWLKAAAAMGDSPVKLTLLRELDVYRRVSPNLSLLRGTNWETKHWQLMLELVGLSRRSKDSITLRDILAASDAIAANLDEIRSLDAQAQSEGIIRKALDELDLWGYQRKFSLLQAKDSSDSAISLVREWRELVTEVSDHQSMATALQQSPFFPMFRDHIEGWVKRLATLQEGMSSMAAVQRKWVYLEPIFARGALPNQATRFRQVDESFRQVLNRIEADPLLRTFSELPGIQAKLEGMQQQLDACQTALLEFLEAKRSLFPRFYFLGDDDLLEILGQPSNPEIIQTHLKKLFAGIHTVTLNGNMIEGISSVEGEIVPLDSPVQVSSVVEVWLGDVTCSMRGALQALAAVATHQAPGRDWDSQPSQVLGLAEELNFTREAEECIKSGSLSDLATRIDNRLAAITAQDLTSRRLAQLKASALVLDVIHHRDVAAALAKDRASATSDWTWKRRLRYYPSTPAAGDSAGSSAMHVVVCMVDAEFQYTWEYQGNAPKLVYTPLTDRCYLTLTQGMALGYGGNPYGPAGTGKTESVKALGQAMGRQVLVFNCDEEFDFRAVGRIFFGLLRCGSWGCFDEFNRLEETVLSAVSQQIQLIQTALRERQPSVTFLDAACAIDHNAGLFVTLNPAGKGYAGRSKLPDNLKALFRSVAMAVPDDEVIAEVLLLAEGFRAARAGGRALVALFSLSRQLLSQQRHYDWGLRSLKTILTAAGRMRRLETSAKTADGNTPEPLSPEAEARLLVQAVCSTKLPALTAQDELLFAELVGDVWPQVQQSDAHDTELREALQAAAASQHLVDEPDQVAKMMQLHQCREQRMGVILMGPSGSGKSTLWRTLAAAYELLGKAPVVFALNPKAMPRQRLLGYMDGDTREWTDGVLTACVRKAAKEPLGQLVWIVCDGNIDPEWVEALNSVLDDNRLLTMPNGERVQLTQNVNFIFECDSLRFASPATVSRCAVIYTSSNGRDGGCDIIAARVATALRGRPRSEQTHAWVAVTFPHVLAWLQSRPDAAAVAVPLAAFASVASIAARSSAGGSAGVAVCRAIAASLRPGADLRGAFLAAAADWCSGAVVWGMQPGEKPEDALKALGSHDAHSAISSHSGSGETGVVVTQTLLDHLAVIVPWFTAARPILLSGPLGSGKRSLIQACLLHIPGMLRADVFCNAHTEADDVIHKLLQVCGKPVTSGSQKLLQPPGSVSLVVVLHDVDLVRPDKFGTVQVLAFLEHALQHGGFYDSQLDLVALRRIHFIGTAGATSADGAVALPPRLARSIFTVAMAPAPEDAVVDALTPRAKAATCTAGSPVAVAPRIASAVLQLLAAFARAFPCQNAPHYAASLHDATAVLDGMRHYDWGDSVADVQDAMRNEARIHFQLRLQTSAERTQFEGMLQSSLGAANSGGAAGGHDSVFSTLGSSSHERAADSGEASKLCQWLTSDFQELVDDERARFEREVKPLPDLHLTNAALTTIAALDAILSRPKGSVLLLGRSGSLRRACLELTVYAQRATLRTPVCVTGVGLRHFRAFLRDVMCAAALEGTRVVVLIEEHHLQADGVLPCLNSLLAGGEVPGLFSPEDFDKALTTFKERASGALPAAGGKAALAWAFTQHVQQNLHVAICLNPDTEGLSERLKANPAILSTTTAIWMNGGGAEQQRSVAKAAIIEAAPAAGSPGGLDVEDLTVLLQGIHCVAEQRGIAAPHHFAALVRQCLHLYSIKHAEISEQIQFLKGGLAKLAEAEATVDALNSEAEQQRKLLTQKQLEVDAAMAAIEAAMEAAGSRKTEVETLSQQQEHEQQAASNQKAGVESQLSEVQPLLESAQRAVGSLKAEHLSEVRSLKAPPAAIRDVLEAVLRLMGQTDTSWNAMKRFLATSGVKDKIMAFDATAITPVAAAGVEALLQERADSFDPDRIYRVSVAAAPLAEWVKANLRYSAVMQRIRPLTDQLEVLQASLAGGAARLVECREELATLDERKVGLQADLSARTDEAAELKYGLKRAEETLTAASSLLSKLSGEKNSWGLQAGGFDEALQTLPQTSAVAAAFIVYAAAEPEAARAALLGEWRRLPDLELPEGFSPVGFLSGEREMAEWRAWGLPGDQLSAENAASLKHALQTPLLIDPNGTTTAWLRHMSASSAKAGTADVVSMHDSRLVTALELAVRFGKTLVITNAATVAPIVVNTLRRDFLLRGTGRAVVVGDKTVDVDEAFRLLLVSEAADAAPPPDLRPLMTVLNFSPTRAGLESALLAATLQHEQPQLESQRSQLLKQEEEMKAELAGLNRTLLARLAQSSGDILADAALIASLDRTKSTASRIATSLASAAALQADLEEQRTVYKPVAVAAAALYLALDALPGLSHTYRFSQAMLFSVFSRALTTAATSTDVTMRIAAVQAEFVRLLCATVLRATCGMHRLPVALHLMHSMFRLRRTIARAAEPAEWSFFLTGVASASGSAAAVPHWVPAGSRDRFCALVDSLPAVAQAARFDDAAAWSAWLAVPAPDSVPAVASTLSRFQQVLILQALRPDRLSASLQGLAAAELGLQSVTPPAQGTAALASEAASGTPVLFIVTAGGDPSHDVRAHALKTKGESGYTEVALGQGQTDAATAAVQSAAAAGTWVCLKNAHLAVWWLPQLERLLQQLACHADFRLWLTSEPHPLLPAGLLSSCLKVAFEPAPGVKHNVSRSLSALTAPGGPQRPPHEMQLQVMLAWLHALVQERRRFIPQGWTKAYEFTASDLLAGRDIMARAIASQGGTAAEPPWLLIAGLLSAAVYGGRIDSAVDSTILQVYIDRVFDTRVMAGSHALPGAPAPLAPLTGATASASTIVGGAKRIADALPDLDMPSTFGLAANVDRVELEAASVAAVVALRGLAAQNASGSGGIERDAWCSQLGPVVKMWEGLLQASRALQDARKIGRNESLRQQAAGASDPLAAFLAAQQRLGDTLTAAIDQSLSGLAAALASDAVPARDVVATAEQLMCGRVPDAWDSLWEGPADPLEYIKAAAARAAATPELKQAHADGRLVGGSTQPVAAGVLFSVPAFVSALRQCAARAARVRVDALQLQTVWNPARLPPAAAAVVGSTGAALTGLLLEGAVFDGSMLTATTDETAPQTELPVVTLAWLPHDLGKLVHDSKPASGAAFDLPLYTCRDRRVMILHITVPVRNAVANQDLVLAGAAAFVGK